MARSDTSPQREAPSASRRVEPLTEIERKILDYMVQYLRANTYQPSIREIGERFGIKSTKTVSEHLQALANKGFLERDPSRSRGVRILGVDLTEAAVSVPFFPHVPTGNGSRHERPEMHVSLDRRLAGREGSFLVRAGASDLAVLGVHEGDWLLVEPVTVDELADGSVVLVRAGGESIFQRFTRNGRGFHLEELRPGGDTTTVEDGTGIEVLGRVTGFYRHMDDVTLNLTQH